MVAWALPAAMLGASAVSGMMAQDAQQSANSANLAMAREQMEFQKEMSNTAYRRSMNDMLHAGLNPILALGSPASTPSGASTTFNPVTGMSDAINSGVSSAVEGRRLNKELDATDSQIKLNTAAEATQQTQQKLNEASAVAAEANAAKAQADTIKSVTEQNILADQRGAIKAKAKADEARSSIEGQYAKESFFLDKVSQGVSTGARAIDSLIPKLRIGVESKSNSPSPRP